MQRYNRSEAELKAELKQAIAHPTFREQNVSGCWREMGAWYDSQGDYANAIKCYKQNLPICERNYKYAKSQRNLQHRQGFAVNLGNAYHDLAVTYKYMKDYEQSEKYDLLYLGMMETSFGKMSKRLCQPLHSLVYLYQEAMWEEKLKDVLDRLGKLYDKVKPDPDDPFLQQAISYTSSLPTPKRNQNENGEPMVALDQDYFHVLIASEKVKQRYQEEKYAEAETLCQEAIKTLTSKPARSTFLEFLLSILIAQEKWDKVADTLTTLGELHPELGKEGKFSLSGHVDQFKNFSSLSQDAQQQLKTIYAQLPGPAHLPPASLERLQVLAQEDIDPEHAVENNARRKETDNIRSLMGLPGGAGGKPSTDPKRMADDLQRLLGMIEARQAGKGHNGKAAGSGQGEEGEGEDLEDALALLNVLSGASGRGAGLGGAGARANKPTDELSSTGKSVEELLYGQPGRKPAAAGGTASAKPGGKKKKKNKNKKGEDAAAPAASQVGLHSCGNTECGKSEDAPKVFKQCSRCQATFYCTVECQRKDWKLHKPNCRPPQ